MTHTHATALHENAGGLIDYPAARAVGCPFDPPPSYRTAGAGASITRVRLWDGSEPWLVTGHAENRALLADPRLSADTARPGYPHVSEGFQARSGDADTRSFITMDDPEHARLRRMVTGSFAIRRVDALRPAIQRIVDRLIDEMLAGPRPADLVGAFALPVPSLVICELLGVPYADHGFFQEKSRIIVTSTSEPSAARRAQYELIEYLERLSAEKLAAPGEDLLSDLAVEQVATGEMTLRQLAAMGVLLLAAGHETTANMIALGTLALLEHPDQLAALRAVDAGGTADPEDPRRLAGAVEELLRYLTIAHMGRRRAALEDIEIGGVTIRAGEGVIIAGDVADRDAAVYADPDRLDLGRDARGHMAFGFGVHQCVGQPLARVELQIAYGTLYRRLPNLRLAVGLDEVPFKHDGLVYGVHRLPVTW